MLNADPVLNGIQYKKNGEVIVPEKIGLGASIDVRFLDTLQKAIIH
jgi:hypothetical protein